MQRLSVVVRVVAVVCGVLLLAGVSGAVVIASDDATKKTTDVAAPSTDGAPAARGRAPAPGTYHYSGGSAGAGPARADVVVTVEADGSGRGLVHQIMTLPFGEAGALRTNVVWSATGMSWQHSEVQAAGLAPTCDWMPATTEYRFPLAVGATWSTDSSCTGSVLGQSATIHRVEQARVTGTAEATVGAAKIPVWVIERTTTITTSTTVQRGQSRTEQTITIEHFSPDRGLFVYRQDHVGGITTELTLKPNS